MTNQVYKTAKGKPLDMGALRLQHENTRAVGNMNVNARGDLIDDAGQVISSKVQQTNQQYKKQIQSK